MFIMLITIMMHQYVYTSIISVKNMNISSKNIMSDEALQNEQKL